jgi:histone-lysine N-methyltransferase SETDB1
MVKKEQEFAQYADTVIAQYQKGPAALHDHNYYTNEEENSFVPHHCSEECWTMGCVVRSPSKYSSLSLPLLLGWRRVFMQRPASEGSRVDSYYSAPCGRRLRSMEEILQFLESCSSVADCNIFITNFTFDPLCSLICPPYNAKSAGAKVFIPDITCVTEAIPITCVNSLTSEPPEHFHYITHREVGPGVHIERDPGFLVSCSCPDNCSNQAGCACWQLTTQEASRTIGPTKHPVGYVHGRLRRPQHSAIYECNARCSCGPRCGNRVVQKGVEHHLQVFRTDDRGWGLRTLRDIPAGSFICTYVGQVFPEHTLESQGNQQQPTVRGGGGIWGPSGCETVVFLF